MAEGNGDLRDQRTDRWWRDRSLWVLAAASAALIGWFVADQHELRAQNVACWLALVVLHIWLVTLAARVALLSFTRGLRRFWWMVTIAACCFLLGDLIQLVAIAAYPATIRTITGVPAQAVALNIGVAAAVLAMLTAPLGLSSPRERLRFWLDMATVVAAGTAWGFYVIIRPSWDVHSFLDLVARLDIVLFGPVLFLVTVFAGIRILLSNVPPVTPQAGWLAVAAAGAEIIIQVIEWESWNNGAWLNLLLASTILANALLTAALIVQLRQMKTTPERAVHRRERTFSFLPYAAIASVYVVLVLTLNQTGLDFRAWTVLAATIACTYLVVVRQILVLVDNAHLVTALNAEVGLRKELAAALAHQAYHDGLTGLANRALFTDRLDAAVEAARRGGGGTAVIMMDLDDFKPVNDRLGHRAGDTLLTQVAARLAACVRDDDIVARLGGDEFGVLLGDPRPESVAMVADRIVRAIATPLQVAGQQVTVSASVGAAVDQGTSRDSDALLHGADSAMYQAKRAGKAKFAIIRYDAEGVAHRVIGRAQPS